MQEIEEIIKGHDEDFLIRKSQEECAELIVALSHYALHRDGAREELVKEVGDVLLHIKILIKLYDLDLSARIDEKVELILDNIRTGKKINFKT